MTFKVRFFYSVISAKVSSESNSCSLIKASLHLLLFLSSSLTMSTSHLSLICTIWFMSGSVDKKKKKEKCRVSECKCLNVTTRCKENCHSLWNCIAMVVQPWAWAGDPGSLKDWNAHVNKKKKTYLTKMTEVGSAETSFVFAWLNNQLESCWTTISFCFSRWTVFLTDIFINKDPLHLIRVKQKTQLCFLFFLEGGRSMLILSELLTLTSDDVEVK